MIHQQEFSLSSNRRTNGCCIIMNELKPLPSDWFYIHIFMERRRNNPLINLAMRAVALVMTSLNYECI